jgi:hypothetical protein
MRGLDRIMALTESVERHVERGEWAEAGTLDAERCRLLAELFADPTSARDLAAYRDVLRELLARNQRTIERVAGRRRELAAESAEARRATGAVHAYRRAAGPGNLVYLREPQGSET